MRLQLFICVLIFVTSPTFGEDYFKPNDVLYSLLKPTLMADGGTDIPFFALIKGSARDSTVTQCGGSIISSTGILTSATCIAKLLENNDKSNVSVIIQSVNRTINHVFTHNRYRKPNEGDFHDYDIAIVDLEEPLNYSSTVQPIELPNRIEYLDEPEWANLTLVAPENRRTMTVTTPLPVVGLEKCKKFGNSNVTQKMICAGLIDAEYRMFSETISGPDNTLGTPLVALGKLQGIFIGTSNQTYIYTRIASVREWIRWTLQFIDLIKAHEGRN